MHMYSMIISYDPHNVFRDDSGLSGWFYYQSCKLLSRHKKSVLLKKTKLALAMIQLDGNAPISIYLILTI